MHVDHDSRAAAFLSRSVLVVVSACGYAAAFPPWNQPWLAFVALVPFLWALRGLSGVGGALVGLAWGTACISFFGYWVPVGLSTYWQQPRWFGFLFALGVAVVYNGSYFALFGWLYARSYTRWRGVRRVLLPAALYVACEFARATLLTGHPWLLLGYASVPYTTWAQMADLGGVYLLSFCLFAFNSSLLELLSPTDAPPARRIAAIAMAAAIVAPLTYGVVRLRRDYGSGPSARIAIVQGNLDLGIQWRDEYFGVGLDRYLTMSYEIAQLRPQLVLWPESAMTFFLADAPEYLKPLVTFSDRVGSELVAGGPYFEPGQEDGPYFNSAFLVSDEGIVARYDKVHLLPFAEYFPLRTIRFLRRQFERVRSFTPATTAQLLPTAVGKAGALICFEAIFPDLVRDEVNSGAELLLNLSNDAWLQSKAGGEQHLLMVRLRAIETRRWVARATTTGVSAFIDPHGVFQGRIESGTAGTLVADVRRSNARTPYVVVGDSFAWACIGAGGLVLLTGRRRKSGYGDERNAGKVGQS